MKKISIISLCLAGVLASCTMKVQLPPDPEVKVPGKTEVTVCIENNETFVWSASDRIGLYDNRGNENRRYSLLPEYAGKSGEVHMFGMGVDGYITAYMPYSEEGYPGIAQGRQPVKAVQKYASSEREHLKTNVVMVAHEGEDGVFRFRYNEGNIGMLHIKAAFGMESSVRRAVISCPTAALAGNVATMPGQTPPVSEGVCNIQITDINRTCSKESPLEFWAIVPCGSFSAVTVSLECAQGWISSPVKGTLDVEAGAVVDCIVAETGNSGNNQNFDIIDQDYK